MVVHELRLTTSRAGSDDLDAPFARHASCGRHGAFVKPLPLDEDPPRMQIASLFSVVPAIVSSGLHLLGVDAATEVSGSSHDAVEQALDRKEAAPVGGIDLTAISPDQFSAWLERLHESGQLPKEAHDDLKALRLELDRRRIPHDQPIDLLGVLKANATAEKSDGAGRDTTELARRQIQWLESLASGSGLNALA